MENKINYSPESLQDLDDIWDYIAMELGNPDAAMNVVDNIMDTIDKLQDFSEIGTRLSSIAGIENDYRFLVCSNYLAFYRTNSQNVYIDRILYNKRDYLCILFDTPSVSEENE